MNNSNAANLRAAADHLEQHPNLETNAPSITVQSSRYLRAQVYPHRVGDTHLSALAEWVSTLTDPKPIHVHHHANSERVTLTLRATLTNGTEAEIVALPDPDELDLLTANTRMEDGDTFPVELLLRLTDRVAAETRIGDALRAERYDPIRYFRHINGARWRVHPDGLVQRRDDNAGLWVDSPVTLDGLVESELVTEDPDRSELPDVPPADIRDQARQLYADGKKIPAIKLVREHTRLGLVEARRYVEALPAVTS